MDQSPSRVHFQGSSHQLSHFFTSPFVVNGLPFSCVQQAYSYLRARSAGDFVTSVAIIASSDPVEQMRLGSTSVPPNQPQWDQVKKYIMMRLDFEKFLQHPDLRQRLIATGDSLLVEDTPNEFWGRGKDQKGLNTAGTILMQLRSYFSNGASAPFPSAVVIGDSLLKDVSCPPALVLPIPGANIRFIDTVASFVSPSLPAAPTAAASAAPRVMIVVTGTNDLVQEDGTFGTPPNLIVKSMRRWVEWYSSHNPDQFIILSTIFPRRTPEKVANKTEKVRRLLIEYKNSGTAPKNLRIFDSSAIIDVNHHVCQDGVQLNAEGSSAISTAIAAAIRSVAGNETPLNYLL